MGLDISIRTDIDKIIYADGVYFDPENGYYSKHSLSRTFCNFMNRQNLGYREPELDQIGRITAVDISSLYQMENYQDDDDLGLEFDMKVAESDEERQHLLEEARKNRNSLKGNIDKVLSIVTSLIDKLSSVDNLHKRLNVGAYDTLGFGYFTDFNVDKGDGYIGNNFGQDLRNFKRFLEFAKDKGATTVYFVYG